MAKDEKLESILYFLIEKTNKVIKRYSQEKFLEAGFDITIDQWVVMKKIYDTAKISQVELAEALFKDTASITRILQLLLKKKFVKKYVGADKRYYELMLTDSGTAFVENAFGLIKSLRRAGIDGIPEKDVEQLKSTLQMIIKNLS